MKSRSEIKQLAKQQFHTQYGVCVGAFILFVLIGNPIGTLNTIYNLAKSIGAIQYIELLGMSTFGVDTEPGLYLAQEIYYFIRLPYSLSVMINQLALLCTLFLMPPMFVGHSRFSLQIYRGEAASANEMLRYGFRHYGRNLGGILWMQLFIFLWSLLLVIPGIVKSLAYFMTPYILADSENVPVKKALKLSVRMTDGYKGDIFIMQLSFIGWNLLCLPTFGLLGILYVNPYMHTSLAGLYHELKQNALESGVVTAEELA